MTERSLAGHQVHGWRNRVTTYLHLLEQLIYVAVALILLGLALYTVYSAGAGILHLLLGTHEAEGQVFRVLDQALIVLMLVEIFHTVLMTIRTDVLRYEPFLVVGLIAGIRRILVLTAEHAPGMPETAYQKMVVELGLSIVLVIVLAGALYLLRRGDRTRAGQSH